MANITNPEAIALATRVRQVCADWEKIYQEEARLNLAYTTHSEDPAFFVGGGPICDSSNPTGDGITNCDGRPQLNGFDMQDEIKALGILSSAFATTFQSANTGNPTVSVLNVLMKPLQPNDFI